VAICARNAEALDDALKACRASGVRADGQALDVSDKGALQAWVARIAKAWDGIDIIVSNVSAIAIGPDEENWRKSYETDLMGAVRLVNASIAVSRAE
jgi:NAD(P)-dependent dehydrogenase (short-subunit alcohol dehydrogenase family)